MAFKKKFAPRRKFCRFCADKDLPLDYKRADILRDFVTERGKIIARRITGVCAHHQRLPRDPGLGGNHRQRLDPMFISLARPCPNGSGRRLFTVAAHVLTHLWSMRFYTPTSARCQGLNSLARNFLCP